MKTYATIREAAIAALAQAVPLAQKNGWEYGGFIRQQGTRYYPVLPPSTVKSAIGVTLSPQLAQITGEKDEDKALMLGVIRKHHYNLVSTYHVHGCDWTVENTNGKKLHGESVAMEFSGQDLMMGKKWGFKQTYIAVACTGNVYENPELTREEEIALRFVDLLEMGGETGKAGVLVGNIRDAT